MTRIHAFAVVLACSFAAIAAPASAAYSYDFSSVDGQDTSTPVTIGPATFSSPGGEAGAFTFSPNAGLYSSFGGEVLSESGNGGSTLNISFATPQSGLQFDFSLGDFFGTNDVLTITTNTGSVLTATATAQSNGDAYPEGTFILPLNTVPITSVALTSTDAFPITIADMSSVSATPLPSSVSMMGLGLVAFLFAGMRKRSKTAWTGLSA